jgi:hypothetical protein
MCATAGKDGRAMVLELRSGKKKGARVGASGEDHVWFEDRWMVASVCYE